MFFNILINTKGEHWISLEYPGKEDIFKSIMKKPLCFPTKNAIDFSSQKIDWAEALPGFKQIW